MKFSFLLLLFTLFLLAIESSRTNDEAVKRKRMGVPDKSFSQDGKKTKADQVKGERQRMLSRQYAEKSDDYEKKSKEGSKGEMDIENSSISSEGEPEASNVVNMVDEPMIPEGKGRLKLRLRSHTVAAPVEAAKVPASGEGKKKNNLAKRLLEKTTKSFGKAKKKPKEVVDSSEKAEKQPAYPSRGLRTSFSKGKTIKVGKVEKHVNAQKNEGEKERMKSEKKRMKEERKIRKEAKRKLKEEEQVGKLDGLLDSIKSKLSLRRKKKEKKIEKFSPASTDTEEVMSLARDCIEDISMLTGMKKNLLDSSTEDEGSEEDEEEALSEKEQLLVDKMAALSVKDLEGARRAEEQIFLELQKAVEKKPNSVQLGRMIKIAQVIHDKVEPKQAIDKDLPLDDGDYSAQHGEHYVPNPIDPILLELANRADSLSTAVKRDYMKMQMDKFSGLRKEIGEKRRKLSDLEERKKRHLEQIKRNAEWILSKEWKGRKRNAEGLLSEIIDHLQTHFIEL